jgi:N-acyl-phosphatidylethanolamine-hydrolysing phospholipase D
VTGRFLAMGAKLTCPGRGLHGFIRRMRKLLLALPLLCGCLVAHEEPAVRGLPRDDRAAPLSAVWVGHATVLLRVGRRTVLTDPNLNGAILVVPRTTPASLRPSELPRIDVAVISHMHLDHFDVPTVRRLGPTTAILYPDGGQPYASEIAQRDQRALKPWESVDVRGLTVTAVPARHQGGRFGLDALWNHAYTGYIIEGAGRRVFFAGDTGYDPRIFREIGARFPDIDLAFVPIAPARPERTRDRWGHASPAEALDIFRDLGAKAMVPIHFEAYYSRGVDHGGPRRLLLAEVERRGLKDRVFALRTGERVVVGEDGPRVISDTGGIAAR